MAKRIGSKQEPLAPALETAIQLQAAFGYFNRALFGGKLQNCWLKLDRLKGRRGGHFIPKYWDKPPAEAASDGEKSHEIAISATLSKRNPLRFVMSVLVHEMVHLQQFDHGKKYAGAYHGVEWGEMMDAIGLPPSATGKPGGRRTGRQMSHYIINGGPFDLAFKAMPPEIALPWRSGLADQDPAKPDKTKNKVKFSCACSQVS